MSNLSTSNPSLASLATAGRPTSYPGTGSDIKRDVKEEALNLAMEIQADLATMQKDYRQKRDQIRQML